MKYYIIQFDNTDFVTYASSKLIVCTRQLHLFEYTCIFSSSSLSILKQDFRQLFIFIHLSFSLIVDCICNTSTHHHVKVSFVNSTIYCDTSLNSSSVVLLYVLMRLYIYDQLGNMIVSGCVSPIIHCYPYCCYNTFPFLLCYSNLLFALFYCISIGLMFTRATMIRKVNANWSVNDID